MTATSPPSVFRSGLLGVAHLGAQTGGEVGDPVVASTEATKRL